MRLRPKCDCIIPRLNFRNYLQIWLSTKSVLVIPVCSGIYECISINIVSGCHTGKHRCDSQRHTLATTN